MRDAGVGRISLGQLLAAILFLGTALASLKAPSEFRFGVLATLTGQGFLYAFVAAVRGRVARPFWVGFVVVGGAYLTWMFAPWIPWVAEPAGARPPTSDLIYKTIFFVQPGQTPLFIGTDESGRQRFETRVFYTAPSTPPRPYAANPTEVVQFGAATAVGYERIFDPGGKHTITPYIYWTDFRLYANIAHLAASILLGFLGGCACALSRRAWRAARRAGDAVRGTDLAPRRAPGAVSG